VCAEAVWRSERERTGAVNLRIRENKTECDFACDDFMGRTY
jgi:hypothetical protein